MVSTFILIFIYKFKAFIVSVFIFQLVGLITSY